MTKRVKDKKLVGEKDIGGRPPTKINWEVMDGILQFGARLTDCVELVGVSDVTIQKKIKEKFNMTFTEYRDLKMSKMRIKLLQKQYDSAMSGNVAMLIFLGKQYLGQSDKQEIINDSRVSLKLSHDEKREMAEAYLKNITEE